MPEVNLAALDLGLLIVFDTVMTERSVSRAAEKLHLTQSAVSHSLNRLRALMDDPLFVRTPKGMQPTSLAEAVAGRISLVLHDIQGIFSQNTAFDIARSTQRITIGLTDYLALVLLPALTQRLHAVAPGIRLVVRPMDRRVSVGMIERGEIDLYVGGVVADPPDHVSIASVFLESSVCIARRGHPAFRGKLTKEDFLAYPHLNISPFGEPGYLDEMLQRQGASRRIALTVGHFLLAPAIVEKTDLIALLPARIARLMKQRYAFVERPCPLDLGQVEIAQIWHRRLDKDPALSWLRHEIEQLLADDSQP
ncbi:MAG: LysR family transcriptional regulator [Steroidobacteraceae bacterium]